MLYNNIQRVYLSQNNLLPQKSYHQKVLSQLWEKKVWNWLKESLGYYTSVYVVSGSDATFRIN